MHLKILFLICILTIIPHFAVADDEPCEIVVGANGEENKTCPDEYTCISDKCVHKDLYPLTQREIIGTFFIMIILGLANAGGGGGSTIASLLLLIFFNFSENKAVMGGYALVFGGSLGNFMNTGFGRNSKTKKPYIDYDLAMICMPPMLLGTSIGILINRVIAPICITIGIIAVLFSSSKKMYIKAKKEYKEESRFKSLAQQDHQDMDDNGQSDDNVEVISSPNEVLVSEDWKIILKEEQELFPRRKIARNIALIIITMIIAFVKGTRKFKSVIGLEYCGDEYWELFAFGALTCLVFLFLNQRSLKKAAMIKKLCNMQNDPNEFHVLNIPLPKLVRYSLIAGILAGMLGTGGSSVMGPILLGLGCSVKSVMATTGFFVIQTSFISLFQSSLYGDISVRELMYFLVISFIGSYGVSTIVSWLIKKYERPSFALFILVFIYGTGLIVMPIFEVWKSFSELGEMIKFSPLC